MPEATGATWTKWLPYAGSSRTSPTLEATLTLSPSLMVANLSGCETMDSEGLVHCLKGKSEA
ncbi:hypothetical protein LEMLEM_LOCUS14494, partial [Lemmus lemmus]